MPKTHAITLQRQGISNERRGTADKSYSPWGYGHVNQWGFIKSGSAKTISFLSRGHFLMPEGTNISNNPKESDVQTG